MLEGFFPIAIFSQTVHSYYPILTLGIRTDKVLDKLGYTKVKIQKNKNEVGTWQTS
jgi:hypothetical protein